MEGGSVAVTTSVGIAIYPQDGEDAETLTKNADAALYEAKGAGKNAFRVAPPGAAHELLADSHG